MLKRVLSKGELSPRHAQYSSFAASAAANSATSVNVPQPSVANIITPKTPISPTPVNSKSTNASLFNNRTEKQILMSTTDHLKVFNSTERLKSQQQRSPVSPASLSTERNVWKIVSQMFKEHVDVDNDNELRSRVREAVNAIVPGNEANKREDMVQRVMTRIEDKKDLMDPYRRPLLFV